MLRLKRYSVNFLVLFVTFTLTYPYSCMDLFVGIKFAFYNIIFWGINGTVIFENGFSPFGSIRIVFLDDGFYQNVWFRQTKNS